METHNEDYYWVTGEVETLEQFRQDLTDDGLFEVPAKKKESRSICSGCGYLDKDGDCKLAMLGEDCPLEEGKR